MPLIKSAVAPSRLAAFSMRDVEAQAALLVSRARERAEGLMAEAQREGEKLRQQASAAGQAEGYQAGRKAGVEEGRKAGHAEALKKASAAFEGIVAGLAGAVESVEGERRRLIAESGVEVIQLAVAIARKVARRQAALAPAEVAKGNVVECLKLAVGSPEVQVVVHPSLVAALEVEGPALRGAFPKLAALTFAGDEALQPGGCRLVTGTGCVDADLDRQIDRLAADLLPEEA